MIGLQTTHAASATAPASAQQSVVPPHLILNGVKVLASADKMPSKGSIGLHFEGSIQILTVKLYTSATFDTVEKFEIRDPSLFTTIKDAIDSGNHDEVKRALLSIRSTCTNIPEFTFSEDGSTQFKITLPTASAATNPAPTVRSKLDEINRLISPLTPSTPDLKIILNDISYKISYFMKDHGSNCSTAEIEQYRKSYLQLGGDPLALMHAFYTR